MNTETPQGYTHLQPYEKQVMLDMRLRGYSIRQISEHTMRSMTTVKKVIYNW